MKILIFVSSMSGGGAERVACTLANTWAYRDNQVTLMPTFSGRGDCFFPLSPAVKLVYLADLVSNTKRTLSNQIIRLRTLRDFIRSENPGVVVSLLANVNIAVILASFGLGIPIIVCEHTDPFVKPYSRSYFCQVGCFFTYPFADTLTVLTDSVKSKCNALIWKLPNIEVMPNPISEEIQHLQHVGGKSANKHLLGVGRLIEGKQFATLIRVFARLVKRHPNWSLRIAGEGPLKDALTQQITDLGLTEHIELLGQISDIGKELVEADIFVSTSRHEGFPMGLLEAMAIGLPCVTFDCPSGPREISSNGEFALLIPLNNEAELELALEKLMTDDALRNTLGSNARASVIARYSLDKVLQKWDLLFKKVGIANPSQQPK
ncbi:glycosyltransferase family 4 protein [Methyloglobulus sp.]|uniref:glycosyltransferase family 4 protein n=1 Tax=Methyloglobulus sp. TaxID=2518622 RepID=UPI0032B73A85